MSGGLTVMKTVNIYFGKRKRCGSFSSSSWLRDDVNARLKVHSQPTRTASELLQIHGWPTDTITDSTGDRFKQQTHLWSLLLLFLLPVAKGCYCDLKQNGIKGNQVPKTRDIMFCNGFLRNGPVTVIKFASLIAVSYFHNSMTSEPHSCILSGQCLKITDCETTSPAMHII